MTDPLPVSLEWIERLVAIDSTSSLSNLAVIGIVEAECLRLGLTPRRLTGAQPGKSDLLVSIPDVSGAVGGGVVISGHTDVVPVDRPAWSSDPFVPHVASGRLYGRGTTDMKSFIGVAVAWLERFSAVPLAEPVHLALSYDEEVGCLGAPDLAAALAALPVLPRACIVGEPTEMQVVAGHKSLNLLRVTFHGVDVHSSLAPLGVNAIEHAARFITEVRAMADGFRRSGVAIDAFAVPHSTISTNLVSGGIAANTVPSLATVQLEFRTVDGDDPLVLMERIESCARDVERAMRSEHPRASVDLLRIGMVPGLGTASGAPAVDLAHRLGGRPTDELVSFGTEAGIFSAAGIPTVVCGPGSIAQAHATDEFVELSQITACEAFFDRLLDELKAPA